MQKLPTPSTNPQLKEIIAQTRQGLDKIYGEQLEQLVFFSLQARHDARKDSDIDLLILNTFFGQMPESPYRIDTNYATEIWNRPSLLR
ncbi:MAG: nucleotidyltransferase domain-containing protein [Trichodesmium sp. St16_bin4-tuft]|nr:nucleotidyltransferase domain-containing protein [Trichodesmium sp. MAG_R01]MDE5074102.1 nucleotidyltransferase domain-containing protein [Trichodesmium sp. St5_bin8]MDE5097958.1 nucleotidyltransferase domain-containing protein [Trichodesmium sp. St16_bin4-tuft]